MNDVLISGDIPPTSLDTNAVVIENLVANYGTRQVLKGLSLQVPTGSIFGLLGANGAGKTTLIKTLLGFRPPDGGSVRVLGFDVVHNRIQICAHIGYVSETTNLYESLTVQEICTLCRDLHWRWKQERVDRMLKRFDLPTRKSIKQFSKGMKAQLAFCLALGNEPDLLILDEPTSELDPIARQVVLDTIIAEVADRGTTIFFSSHLLAEIETLADHVAILHDGKVALCDELDHIRATHRELHLTYENHLPDEEITNLRNLPGVLQLEQEGRHIRLRIKGNADNLVATVQERPYTLHDVEVISSHLDQVLLEYLKGNLS